MVSELRVSDEYDVLRHLGQRSLTQDLLCQGDGYLDQHHCEDGTQLLADCRQGVVHDHQHVADVEHHPRMPIRAPAAP